MSSPVVIPCALSLWVSPRPAAVYLVQCGPHRHRQPAQCDNRFICRRHQICIVVVLLRHWPSSDASTHRHSSLDVCQSAEVKHRHDWAAVGLYISQESFRYLRLGAHVTSPSQHVRLRGVIISDDLILQKHVNTTCFRHLRQLRHIRLQHRQSAAAKFSSTSPSGCTTIQPQHTWPSVIFCLWSYCLIFAYRRTPRSRLYREYIQTVAKYIFSRSISMHYAERVRYTTTMRYTNLRFIIIIIIIRRLIITVSATTLVHALWVLSRLL